MAQWAWLNAPGRLVTMTLRTAVSFPSSNAVWSVGLPEGRVATPARTPRRHRRDPGVGEGRDDAEALRNPLAEIVHARANSLGNAEMSPLQRTFAALTLVSAAIGASSAVAQTTNSEAESKALRFYPPAARTARIQGWAELTCGRNEHNALRNCVLVKEEPQGYGFGEAALKLAARSPDNPAATVTATDAGERKRITFCLNPPLIYPNELLPRHVIEWPRLIQAPSREDILSVEPASDIARNLNGWVSLGCRVGADGSVGPCRAGGEGPLGYGLGQAAVSLASKIKATPKTSDGVPQDDGWIEVPVYFGTQQSPFPPAPLPQAADWLCSHRAALEQSFLP